MRWFIWLSLTTVLLLNLVLWTYRSWRRRKAAACVFSRRERWDSDKYLAGCEASCDISKTVAVSLRAVLAQKSSVPIECIHSDDRIDIELADLPAFFDGFPWLDVFAELEAELDIGLTGRDHRALYKWHVNHMKQKEYVCISILFIFLKVKLLSQQML